MAKHLFKKNDPKPPTSGIKKGDKQKKTVMKAAIKRVTAIEEVASELGVDLKQPVNATDPPQFKTIKELHQKALMVINEGLDKLGLGDRVGVALQVIPYCEESMSKEAGINEGNSYVIIQEANIILAPTIESQPINGNGKLNGRTAVINSKDIPASDQGQQGEDTLPKSGETNGVSLPDKPKT